MTHSNRSRFIRRSISRQVLNGFTKPCSTPNNSLRSPVGQPRSIGNPAERSRCSAITLSARMWNWSRIKGSFRPGASWTGLKERTPLLSSSLRRKNLGHGSCSIKSVSRKACTIILPRVGSPIIGSCSKSIFARAQGCCLSSVLICGWKKTIRNEMRKSFESSRAPEPVGAFPHAKRVGNLLFLSGIGPRVRGSKKIPGVTLDSTGKIVSYDIEAQCRAVFENVRLVLEDAGATWQDIIDVTVFLTNMKKDFPIYNRIYAEYFAGPGKPNPTRTTIEVGALPTPIAIELKVIAAVG